MSDAPEVPLEKRFAALCGIVRAQHFAWREAVASTLKPDEVRAMVERMWEVSGRDTAAAYLKRIDRDAPLPGQVAEHVAASSRAMGEDAFAEPGDSPDEAFVRHVGCPWLDWHRKHGLEDEDRPGCDAWFRSTVEHLGRALGARLQVETLVALPDGDLSCLRRVWIEGGERPAGAAPEREGGQ